MPNLVVLGQTVYDSITQIRRKKALMARLLRPHKVIRTDTNRSATYDFLSVTMGLSRTVSEINDNYFCRKSQNFPTPLCT